MRVLIVSSTLAGIDLVTGVLATVVFDRANLTALVLFILVHLTQMVTAPAVVLYFD